MKTHSLETKAANGCGKRNAHQKWPKANLIMSMISRVGDFCVFTFLPFIYRYGSSLSVYSTRRRPGDSVSDSKFQLLYSLLVSPHTNKSTKDDQMFHFTI